MVRPCACRAIFRLGNRSLGRLWKKVKVKCSQRRNAFMLDSSKILFSTDNFLSGFISLTIASSAERERWTTLCHVTIGPFPSSPSFPSLNRALRDDACLVSQKLSWSHGWVLGWGGRILYSCLFLSLAVSLPCSSERSSRSYRIFAAAEPCLFLWTSSSCGILVLIFLPGRPIWHSTLSWPNSVVLASEALNAEKVYVSTSVSFL